MMRMLRAPRANVSPPVAGIKWMGTLGTAFTGGPSASAMGDIVIVEK